MDEKINQKPKFPAFREEWPLLGMKNHVERAIVTTAVVVPRASVY